MVEEPTKYDNPEDAGVDVPSVKGANKPKIGIMPKLPPMNNTLDNPMNNINPNDPAPWEGNNPEGEGEGGNLSDPIIPVDPNNPNPSVDPNQPGSGDPNKPPIDPQSALAQKEHWRDKYNRDAIDPTTGKTYKELLGEKENEVTPVTPAPTLQPETNEDFQVKQDFLWKHTDNKYTPDEFAHIKSVSKSKGVSLDEAAVSEENYIQFQRGKVANEDKIPSPSFPGSPEGGGQTLSPEKIEAMSEDDFKREEERVHKAGQRIGSGGGV